MKQLQNLFNNEDQQNLLKTMAIRRVSRKTLSKEIGISVPTTRKLLDASVPVIVTNKTYQAVQHWMIAKER